MADNPIQTQYIMSNSHVLLFAFDGLLPAKISEELTPNLHRFKKRYTSFQDHRAAFPTETYINQVTLFTGSYPARHGFVSNAFFHPATGATQPLVGARVEDLEKAGQTPGFFPVPTVGEILGQAGKKMVGISSNSLGSTRLINHRAENFQGHICLSPRGEKTAILPGELKNFYGTLSRLPQTSHSPDLDGLRGVNEIFFQLADKLADLTVLWYGEPDNVFHYSGLHSDKAVRGIKEADRCFGEIISWWEAHPRQEMIQVIVMSDHGHIENQIEFSLFDALQELGFSASTSWQTSDIAVIAGRAGNIWVKNHNTKRIRDLAFAMMETPWLGMLFSPPANTVHGEIEGTFSTALVYGNHAHGGDLRFVLRDTFENARPGSYFCDSMGRGAGNHGGLHPDEIQTLLLCGGSAFREHTVVETPGSVINVAPTLLKLLDMEEAARQMDGRILAEALRQTPSAAGKKAIDIVYTTGRNDFEQQVVLTDTGHQRLIKSGRRT